MRSLLLGFFLLFLGASLPSDVEAQTPPPPAKAPALLKSYLGDVSLRVSAGSQLFSFSYATGEPISHWIDPNGLDLLFFLEYGYFYGDRLMFFLSVPMTFYISPVLGTLFTLQLGLGIRYFLGTFFYIDAQALLSFWQRSLFAPDFGGFILGAGVAIPLQERFRLLLTLQLPINFVDGFRFGWNTLAGAEILF